MTVAQFGARRRLQTTFHDRLAYLPLPASGSGLISAVPIPLSESNRLGRDERGNACVIIAVAPDGSVGRPDVRLRNLMVQRRARCDILRDDGSRETIEGVVVTCLSASPDLSNFFLDLFDQVLETLGDAPSERDVDVWIEHAYSLFSELDEPLVREIRGLWGELLFIATSRDPDVMVRAWHDDPGETFDFLRGSFALEVKTCQDLNRTHIFSLDQLRPRTGISVIVASVPVRPDPLGTSAVDLLLEIESKLRDSSVRARLREVTFRMGGAALAESPQRFDRRFATSAMRYFKAVDIPAFDAEPAPAILKVQLTVRCRDLASEELGSAVLSGLRDSV